MSDTAIPEDVQEKLLRFARAGIAVATMRGKSYLSLGGTSMGIAGSIVDAQFLEGHLGMRVETVDMTEILENQMERFAPGFRDRVLGRHAIDNAWLERYNSNCVGGDVIGGAADLAQLFFRPMVRAVPYKTPNPRLFLCSASTPPGGGVHGLCGYFAARVVIDG